MEIVVQRTPKSKSTIGEMYINGVYIADTLEDVQRPKGVKIYGETAIPQGKYKVVWTYSPKFGRCLPEVLSVPGFTAIRIHSGNTTADTLGCILVGTRSSDTTLVDSRKSANLVYSYVENASKRGEPIWLTIAE